jgi:regulator of ribonuclease activity A
MALKMSDLCDDFGTAVRAADPMFRAFGGRAEFAGPIATLKVHEDNKLVRETLSTPGLGRVLVVDGGGSQRCALVGDQLAQLAVDHGWVGIIVYGCIRDSAALGGMAIGVRALATHPRRCARNGEGTRNIPVTFAGVTFAPGQHVYVDEDGIVTSDAALG